MYTMFKVITLNKMAIGTVGVGESGECGVIVYLVNVGNTFIWEPWEFNRTG